MPKKRSPAIVPHDEIKHRVRLIRELAHGAPTQAAMAKRAGISPQQWGNYETGVSRVSLDVAARIAKAMPGMTIDFIVLGERGGLSQRWLEAIEDYETDPPEPEDELAPLMPAARERRGPVRRR